MCSQSCVSYSTSRVRIDAPYARPLLTLNDVVAVEMEMRHALAVKVKRPIEPHAASLEIAERHAEELRCFEWLKTESANLSTMVSFVRCPNRHPFRFT